MNEQKKSLNLLLKNFDTNIRSFLFDGNYISRLGDNLYAKGALEKYTLDNDPRLEYIGTIGYSLGVYKIK